jgi:hypothetical protein
MRLNAQSPPGGVSQLGPGSREHVPRRPPLSRRLATAARWPLGVGLTSWRYMWRTTPMRRQEVDGSLPQDEPRSLSTTVDPAEMQTPQHGVGPLFHRRYRIHIRDSSMSPRQLMDRVREDPDRVAPSEFASFQKVHGRAGGMERGDEYVVRMPGPWDGPVRVAELTPTSFRLVTLEGHLEAGQIEFRALSDGELVVFEIESWARSGDRLSDLLYDRLRMSKEIQLHMWTSTLERIAKLSGGRRTGAIAIETRKVPAAAFDG